MVTANYRTRFGEIDLIMRDGNALVFVEVRQRRSAAFGSAAESITASKRAKIVRAAQAFLQTSGHVGPVRFDVIAFDGSAPAGPTWIKSAFEAER